MKVVATSSHAIIGLLLLLPNEGSSLTHERKKNGQHAQDHLEDGFEGHAFPRDPIQEGYTPRGAEQGIIPFNEGTMAATAVVSPPRGLLSTLNVCEDSTMIEIPPGESSSTVQGRNDLGIVDPDYPCYVDPSEFVASFLVVGTGNVMYATSCSAEIPEYEPNNILISPIGDAAQGCNITAGVEREYCLFFAFSLGCPLREADALGRVWKSTEGVLYHIVIPGYLDQVGNFTLTVGEVSGDTPANDVCPDAIPLELENGMVSVIGSNDGATVLENERCWNAAYATVWYSIKGSGKKMVATTCSEKTAFQSSVSVLSSFEQGSQLPCDYLACQESSWFSNPPCEYGTYGTVAWITTPDELYFIQVASSAIGFTGAFELIITEADPTPRDRCDIAKDLYINNNPNSVCDCHNFGESAELTCVDYCVHCDASGTACINTTEVTTFLGAQETIYKHTIQQSEGRNELIEHTVTSNGTCTVSVDGIQCASCSGQPCGAPMLDCSNIDERLDSADMCSIDDGISVSSSKADVASSALYGLVSSEFATCTFFLSTFACDAALADSALDSTRSCECGYYSYDAQMSCTSTCGYFCNDDETICFVEDSVATFDQHGSVSSKRTNIQYRIGNDNALLEVFHDSSDSTCGVYTSGGSGPGWSCGCEVVPCNDGTHLPSFACSDSTSDAIFAYNYCTPSKVDDGVFLALSSEGINECIDKSPANDMCIAATPIAIDELVTTAIHLASESQYDACLDEERIGLWFTFIGTGSILQLSPANAGNSLSTFVSIQKGDCDALECITSTGSATVAWYAEEGITYTVHAYDLWGNGAVVVHDFRVETASQSMQACIQDWKTSKDMSCDCFFYQANAISGFVFEQSCVSTCEKKCNSQRTSCGSVVDEWSMFDEIGKQIRFFSKFEYNALESGLSGSIYSILESDRDFCEGGVEISTRRTPCTSCQLTKCPDSDLVAPLLNCSNFVDGGVYHLCGDVSVEGGSRFEIWDDRGFPQCFSNGTAAPTLAPTGAPAGGDATSVQPSTTSAEIPPTSAPTASSAWRMQSVLCTFLVAACSAGVLVTI